MTRSFPRLKGALTYAACWLPILVLQAVMLRQGQAGTIFEALLYAATYLAPGVLLGGLCWQVAARVPWTRLNWASLAGIELGLALVFVAGWHAIFVGYLFRMAGPDIARGVVRTSLGWLVIIGLLVYGFHAGVFHALRISRALRLQQVAAAEAGAMRVRAEMNALRGQLDPHFLFNSLHSITALVREDPARAEEALLQFSALLRRVLAIKRDSTDEVTLADEMKFVDDYLAIERLRLGDRLRVTRDFPPGALECWLPAFSVQPLVENAVRHALAPRRDGGTITLRAAVRDGRLEIAVADDGPGADPAALAAASGVGLRVIRQRLALRHGSAAALAVDTTPGRGFRTTLSLPAQTGPLVGQVSDLTTSTATPSEGGPQTRPTPA